MTPTPELDQVAAMRRKLAATTEYPRTYWVLFGAVLVLFAGTPIWMALLPDSVSVHFGWVILAVAAASTVYSVLRRRRSGVYLPKRISAYPSAYQRWKSGIVVTIGGFVLIQVLVAYGQRGVALAVLPVVAVALFAVQVATQRAMRRDIEAGRVVP